MRLDRSVEDVAQTIDGDADLVEILPHLDQPQDRTADLAREHGEGDQLADRHFVVDDEMGAEKQRNNGGRLVQKVGGLGCHIADLGGAKRRPHVARQLLFPAPLHYRLDCHRLYRLDPGDAFDQEGLVLGAAPEFLIEPAAKGRSR